MKTSVLLTLLLFNTASLISAQNNNAIKFTVAMMITPETRSAAAILAQLAQSKKTPTKEKPHKSKAPRALRNRKNFTCSNKDCKKPYHTKKNCVEHEQECFNLYCSYCSVHRKSKRYLDCHEISCSENPNRRRIRKPKTKPSLNYDEQTIQKH